MNRIALYCSTFLMIVMIASCGGDKEKEGKRTIESKEEQANEDNGANKKGEIKEAKRKSPREIAKYVDRDFNVVLKYGSPRVRGRVIWGNLVPYDTIWRAGANETTAIKFTKDVSIKDTEIKAGTYGMFIIPKKEKPWTIILNEEWSKEKHGAWGAYNYNPEKDVARFDVQPSWNDESLEELTYEVTDSEIIFKWEKAQLNLPYKTL